MAELGDVNAQFQLANFYFEPPKYSSLPKDQTKAAYLYRLAAMQGHAPSQHNLAVLLFKGVGVERDVAQSHAWFELAAEQGVVAAKKALKALGDSMTDDEKRKAGQIRDVLKGKIK